MTYCNLNYISPIILLSLTFLCLSRADIEQDTYMYTGVERLTMKSRKTELGPFCDCLTDWQVRVLQTTDQSTGQNCSSVFE